ncbi:MAG: exosortase/archaeosortase family protein [Deltaproteobacteria bacterium]|nr:exosortase/archaeosortase family protein [Deltaproteobacteria bacterium]
MTSVEDSSGDLDSVKASEIDRLLTISVVVFGLALCVPGLLSLSFLWESSLFYGHAYAIPVMAAYLAYANLGSLRIVSAELRPPLWGSLVVFGAATLQVLALMGDIRTVVGLGIPLLLGAIVYAIGGRRLLAPMTLPLIFLALMVPPPRFVTYQILFRLKLMVTEVAVAVLQVVGTTVTAEGNQILVPGHTLFVADACSGLTSIVTLMPLACIVAYFLSHGVWRRVIVVASVVPLTFVANVFRVIVTVRMVSTHGAEFAQGVLHETFGLATYVIGTLAVIGVARITR